MTLDSQTAPAPAADNSPLTLDQAVDLQMKARAPAAPEPDTAADPEPQADDAADVVDEAQESEAAPQADDDVESEPTEANAEDDAEGQPEPAPPAIEPPKFWDAEGKDSFAKLPAEAQKAVLKYEEQRTKAVARAMQESAETRKTFEAKQKQLQDVSERIGEYADSAATELQEWKTSIVEWNDWFASQAAIEMFNDNPAQYRAQEAEFNRIKATFQQKSRAYQKAIEDKATAESVTFKAYAEEQARLIPELIPELADEKEGPARKRELFSYLRTEGFEPERINGISAKEAQLAWKAKQFDALGDVKALARDAALYRKANALATKPPAPKPKPAAGPNAPSAGQGQRPSSSEARFKQLSSKPSLSMEEATEFGMLKAKLRK